MSGASPSGDSPRESGIAAPPRWTERLLIRALPDGPVGRTILGDLREQFLHRAEQGGFRAGWWYRREALSVALHSILGRIRGRGLATGSWGDRASSSRVSNWMLLRTAVRNIARSWSFAATVACTLAVGLGANVAVFEMADRLLLAYPDHIVDAGDVVRLYVTEQASDARSTPWMSEPDARAFRQVAGFERVAAYTGAGLFSLGRGQAAETVRFKGVSAELFPLLGVDAVRGRRFDQDDDRVDAEPTIMLTEAFWRSRFGGDPDLLGSVLTLNETDYRVIGITPAGFTGVDLSPVDAFVALDAHHFASFGSTDWVGDIGWRSQFAVARMADDVDVQAVTSAASAVWSTPRLEEGDAAGTVSLVGLRVVDSPTAPAEVAVTRWLLAVSVLLMLVACANVTNLMLMRGVRRRRLVAVHRALGLSARGVVGTIVLETLVLAALGGVGAILTAQLAGDILQPLLYPGIQFDTGLPSPRLFGYAGLVTLLAALIAAVVPGIQAVRSDPLVWLRGSGSSVSSRRGGVASLAVAVQTGLSVVLVVGAGLFLRSLHNATSLDLGFDDTRIAAGSMRMSGDADLAPVIDAAAERLRALPGVVAVSTTAIAPFHGGYQVPLRTPTDSIKGTAAIGPWVYPVDDVFFRAMDIPIVRGRDFQAEDNREGAPRVVIVNEVMAATIWPNQEALGQCLLVSRGTTECSVVIGIVPDHAQRSLIEDASMKFYVPVSGGQMNALRSMLIVRTEEPIADKIGLLRDALWDPDPAVRSVGLAPYSSTLAPQTRSWRLGATVFSAFGLISLAVAGIGLYSVLGFRVAQQQRSLGIEMALGASAGRLVSRIVSDALGVTLAGVLVGLPLAGLMGWRMRALLFAVEPVDAVVFALSALGLTVVAGLAAVLPSLRATRTNPVEALRSE